MHSLHSQLSFLGIFGHLRESVYPLPPENIVGNSQGIFAVGRVPN